MSSSQLARYIIKQATGYFHHNNISCYRKMRERIRRTAVAQRCHSLLKKRLTAVAHRRLYNRITVKTITRFATFVAVELFVV